MFDKYKEEFFQNPAKFIIIFIILLILALVCIYQFKEYLTGIWPDRESISKAKRQLKQSQVKLQETLNTKHRLMKRRESFINNSSNFWLTDRDGDASLNIQKKVNNAAASTGIQLSSVGAARNEKVTDGISLVSISIRSKASLKKIAAFINEIEKIKPRAYWKSLVLRPDNPRKPVEIVLSGNIQFIIIENEEALTLLQETK